MVRLAVTTWLVVATLLGPWLCCCTAAAPARPPAAREVTPKAVSPKASPCCAHKKAEPQKPDDPRPDRPHRDSCPCKEGVAKVSATPPSPTAGLEFPAPVGYIPLPAGGFDPVSGTSIHADRGEGLPPLSAGVLLHVFHNLRC